MASVVLGIVGNFIYPGIGGLIGAAVGGVIDTVVINAIVKATQPEPPPRPEIERDFSADQGNPIPWIAGTRTRVSGQVIAAGGLRELEITTPELLEFKNKDSDRPGSVTYKWVVDVAIAFCRNVTDDIEVVWANGTKIFDRFPNSTGEHTVEVDRILAYDERVDLGCNNATTNCQRREIVKFIIDRDLRPPGTAGIVPGSYVEIDGPEPANTGVFYLLQVLPYPANHPTIPPPFESWKFVKCFQGDPGCTPGVSVPAPAGLWGFLASVPIPENVLFMGDYRIYTGERTQVADTLVMQPLLDSVGLGAFNPANRGTTYMAIKDLNATKWGGTLPRFEALVRKRSEAQGIATIGTVIREVIERGESVVGVEVDVTQTIGEVFGLAVLGPIPIVNTLRQLMLYYNLDANETASISFDSSATTFVPKITFINKALSGLWVIPLADRGAREFGSDGDFHIQEVVVPDRRDLPSKFVLDYQDLTRDYQTSSVSYTQKIGVTPGARTTKFSTDLNLRPGDALFALRILLWTAQQNHDQLRVTLPPNWSALQPGDRLLWQASNLTDPLEIRITDVEEGQNGMILVEGTVDDSLQYTQDDQSDIPPAIAAPDYPGSTSLFMIDIPPLSGAEAKLFGLYVFNHTVPPANPASVGYWEPQRSIAPPTSIFKSTDDGGSWIPVNSQAYQGISGWTAEGETLGDGVSHVVDTANTITIEVDDTTVLTSADPEDVASFRANVALIGSEIVGYEIATQTGVRTYELSCLHRGRRNTEAAMESHEENELFVLLVGAGGVRFVGLPSDDFQRELDFVSVPNGQAIVDIEPFNSIQSTPNAETLRPFTTTCRWVRRFEDRSIRLYFQARTRLPWRLFSGVTMPRCEMQHCFKLRIYWMAPAAQDGREFIRELCCCFGNDNQFWFTYTREEQIEDFHKTGRITDGDFPYRMELELSQCSDTIGDGRPNIVCLNKIAASYVQFDMCPPAT